MCLFHRSVKGIIGQDTTTNLAILPSRPSGVRMWQVRQGHWYWVIYSWFRALTRQNGTHHNNSSINT